MFFLGGLIRSGNTVLSAILNENPNIYCSPLSPLLDHLVLLDNDLRYNEKTNVADWDNEVTKNISAYAKSYYNDKEEPIIIDRHKQWGCALSVTLAVKYITPKPRILFTVRDIPSILASFVTLLKDKDDTFLDKHITNYGLQPYNPQTRDDVRCDFLMNYNGLVQQGLVDLSQALNLGVPIHLIEYDDLVNNGSETMNGIYDFLEIDNYSHNFKNISKVETETPEAFDLPSNIHDVRKELKRISLKPEEVLSPLSFSKYSGLEFWRK